MHLFHKHFKYNDSWMWFDWVRHQNFWGLPRLRFNFVEHDLHFNFELLCGKIHWYWTTGRIKK